MAYISPKTFSKHQQMYCFSACLKKFDLKGTFLYRYHLDFTKRKKNMYNMQCLHAKSFAKSKDGICVEKTYLKIPLDCGFPNDVYKWKYKIIIQMQ